MADSERSWIILTVCSLTQQPMLDSSLGPATSESFFRLQRPLPYGAGLTEAEAAHVIQAERDNLDKICDIIDREGLEVDLWRGLLCEGE